MAILRAVNLLNLPSMQDLMRASDWVAPLALMLSGGRAKDDGHESTVLRVANRDGSADVGSVTFAWSGLGSQCEHCARTYQTHALVEFAALGVAAALVSSVLDTRMLEVTQRGDRADYWIGDAPGDRSSMLEVSGTSALTVDLERLGAAKARQLLENPFGAEGYVCVVHFARKQVILGWAAALLGGSK